jgi:hypothetical protein
MKFTTSQEFLNAAPETVINHLESVKRVTIRVNPHSLVLKTGTGKDAQKIYLMVTNGRTTHYEIRKTFLLKLLKWYSFPNYVLNKLSTETIISIGNDFFLNIKSGDVFIKFENDEALTITSNRYADVPDLEILKICSGLGFDRVTRNDFFMSINSKINYKVQAIPGDDCGFGYNLYNSETGFGALKISHYILRYICANGAMVALKDDKSKPLVHYDITKGQVIEYINSSIQVLKNTRDKITAKLKLLPKMEDKEMLETVKRRLSVLLGIQTSQKLLDEYTYMSNSSSSDFDGSQYSLFNFITSKAKTFDIFKRTMMEDLAGSIFLS